MELLLLRMVCSTANSFHDRRGCRRATARRVRMRRRIPCWRGAEKQKADRFSSATHADTGRESRLSSRENFEASFEAVGFECLFPFLIVVRVVGVEPIALGIDMEIGDLSQFRRLNQKLLFRD